MIYHSSQYSDVYFWYLILRGKKTKKNKNTPEYKVPSRFSNRRKINHNNGRNIKNHNCHYSHHSHNHNYIDHITTYKKNNNRSKTNHDKNRIETNYNNLNIIILTIITIIKNILRKIH